jgi:uncharacterized protein YfaS (alpha-2-macroglobulin family)
MVLAFLASASPTSAQSPVPERRIVVVDDTDFYGGDISSVFDTTFENCWNICLQDPECRALTFNTQASACFLKSGFEEMRAFDGAVSARVVELAPEARELAAERADELSFLPEGFLDEARTLAAGLGALFPVNAYNEADLVSAARRAARSGQMATAASLRGAALNLNDAPGGWLELSEFHLAAKKGKRTARRNAVAAAINGYLRSQSPVTQAAALDQLAMALEARGYGREMIPALRLSMDLSPRGATDEALARAISLYGFRIVEHTVDSDAASPRICLTFSEPLVEAGVDYAPYFRLADASLPIEADGRQICIDGVTHGERYQFTVRSGLPAANGETLLRSADLEIYVRDRSPSVRFLGRAYVLPKSGNAAIPVVSVNLDEVDLKIHRVGDRNLLAVIQDGLFDSALSGYSEARIRDRMGEPVWSGTGEVERRLNADVTTALPIGDAISSFEPGAYVMTARAPDGEDEYWEQAATQWFVVTDLGLTSMTGTDGLHVFVRALSSAEAAGNARLRLIAKNNEVLGETVSDAAGYARFAPGLTRGKGGSAPALLTVEADDGDFAFIDLSDPGMDLSDRGVAGRASPAPVDVFLTTERGAYRPGERVFATILARDMRANAVADLPLTAIVTRPDGVEFSRLLLEDQGAGGRVLDFALDPGAQRGTWRVSVYADVKADALAGAAFLVEDFLPERIEFDMTAPEGPVDPAGVPVVSLEARYLYGAPGAGLAIEGEARVAAAEGLPGYPGFRFGLHDEWVDTRFESVDAGYETDETGRISVPLRLPEMDAATRPLELTAILRVRDGSGRPVERTLSRALAPDGPRIGIKPLFDGVAEEGGLARFEMIAVGTDTQRTSLGRVAWTLSRLQTTYQWYELDGSWNYEPVTTRERVASGQAKLTPDAMARIETPVDWGRYELKAVNLDGGYTATSVVFSAGWYSAGASVDTPDRIDVGLDQPAYAIGETARVRLTSRVIGKALVTVVDNRLIDMRAVDVAPGETLVEFPVTDAWGPGAYVTATLISPMDVAAGRNPARAIGLSWVPVDPGSREISARFTTRGEVSPRGRFEAVLQIKGMPKGETAYATIAAVDVGILNLTGFEAPAPEDWYFGQRKLGMELRDLYGRLIDATQGAPGQIRSGGDASAGRGNAPPPTQDLVAFFSGPVIVDAQGRATASFDLPDFNGTVRLMAIVWSQTGVGHAVKDILVRDPVVVSVGVPRFLAPSDSSRVQIDLAHVTGPAGDVSIELLAGSELSVGDGWARQVTLGSLERKTVLVPVAASTVGDPTVGIVITTPDGKRLEKVVRLPVRANDPEIARQNRIPLAAAGGSLTVDASTFAGFVPGTGRATLAVGPVARFDVPGLLTALDRYPYGCTEQLTSRAMPLLYFDQVTAAMGLGARKDVSGRVAQAIRKVLANQSNAGGFGLWRPGRGDLWLDAYVTDFLSRARQTGHEVPDAAFTSALDNLRNQIAYAGDFEDGGEDIAYALMVLAREGMASIGDLRYYADAKADALATPLAKAQLGAALASYGEQQRADAMFRLAAQQVGRSEPDPLIWRADYGSHRRDAAAVLALAAEAGSLAVDSAALTRRISAWDARRSSTQEKVWTLMAAQALIGSAGDGSITVDGVAQSGPVIRLFQAEALGDGGRILIENRGDEKVDAVLTTFGVPAEPEPASGNGYTIERAYYTMEGEPVSPEAVPQNARFVAVLTVVDHGSSRARLMVDDPLPAGFEIDNPNLLRSGDLAALGWLDLTDDIAHAEFRSDRFLAAVDADGGRSFELAYIVRAVSPGRFHHPAAIVEDMYRPEFRARTAAGTVEVLGPTR